MSKKVEKKGVLNPFTAGVSAAVLASSLSIGSVQAADNPFASQELNGGFMLAGKNHEGKCGEGKKDAEGKCGEGKKDAEGKCGEGKKDAEGKCGEGKKDTEGKCGEAKCGGNA